MPTDIVRENSGLVLPFEPGIEQPDIEQPDRNNEGEEKRPDEGLMVANPVQENPLAILPLHLQISRKTILCLTPVFAAFTTLSAPIFAMYLQRNSEQSLEQKIWAPIVPWAIIAICSTWLQANSIAARADGQVDDELSQIKQGNEQHDSWHVFLALIANLSTVTNGMMVMLTVLPGVLKTRSAAILWPIVIFCGLLNGLVNLYTNVVAAFRKHVEYHDRHRHRIHHLFDQQLFKPFADNAYCFATVIREVYPVINALARAQAAFQLLEQILMATSLLKPAIKLIALLVAYCVYSASAFVLTHFEMAQLVENLANTGREIRLKNSLSYSSFSGVRMAGRIISGQMLFDGLERITKSSKISVRILLVLNAFGLMSLVKRSLANYVISDNSAAVQQGNEGLLITYLAGKKDTIRYGQKLNPLTWFLAGSIGPIESAVKSAMVNKRVKEEQTRETQNQVRPVG